MKNPWLIAACVIICTLIPCAWVCVSGRLLERFAALQLAQVFTVLVLLLLAEGYRRDIYFDMALVLAVLSFASGLVYVRFLERWL